MLKLGSRISCISGGENWDGMREAVARASDFNEREEVLMIIDQVSDLARREQLLKRLNAGLADRKSTRLNSSHPSSSRMPSSA